MINYKLRNCFSGGQIIEKTDSESNRVISINQNPDSRHYQEYLAWLAEGNEPLPLPADSE